MKTIIALLLSSTASAQLTFCKDTSECPEETIPDGGCCQNWTVQSWNAETDVAWGFIQEGVFQNQEMVEGVSTATCMNGAMVKCRAEKGEAADNVTDLQCFLDSNPGIGEALGLDEETVEALVDAWGSNMDFNAGLMMTNFNCLDGGAAKLAMTGAALAAAYFAL